MQTNTTFHIAFHAERSIDAQSVRDLYDLADWWPNRQLGAIADMLDQDIAIGAWNNDHLIAFARTVTDGRFRAYIEDVVVHPTYRRQRIAVQILERLVDSLTHIETISLFCASDLVSLYEHVGFKARRSQVVMHHKGRS